MRRLFQNGSKYTLARLMRTSAEGLELIKSFEGFRARAAQTPSGVWLIGYGHTATARAGLEISPHDAALILRHHDLPDIEQLIAERVLTPLSQNEFDALVSFIFNIGPGAFLASSVLDALNAGDRAAAADAMWAWRLANVSGELRVVDALARRRAAEIALFLEHPDGRAAIPGAWVRPLVRAGRDDEEAVPGARTVVIAPRAEDTSGGQVPSTETQAQAAARAVGERIARILGEIPPQPPAPPPLPPSANEGPTPEEITDALKALIGDEPGPALRGKGPPEGIERRRGPRPPDALVSDNGAPPALPPAEGLVVDDLEIVKIDAQDIERAIHENGDIDLAKPRHAAAWLPYALLSGLGLIGLIAGVERFLTQASRPVLRESDVYAGPVLALGGGFLFLIASYYLFRALTRHD
jgi:lysozyme